MYLWGTEWTGKVSELEFRIKIKYEGFNVVGALLEIPEDLVAAGLIMEDLDDAFALDVLATWRGVLQYLLCLIQVH